MVDAGLSALIIAPVFAFLVFIYEPGQKAILKLLYHNSTQMDLYNGLNSSLTLIKHFMLDRHNQAAQ